MKNSNKGLNHDEPILFEIGGVDKSELILMNQHLKKILLVNVLRIEKLVYLD